VIVVGNILSEAPVNAFRDLVSPAIKNAGKHPAVISRGYASDAETIHQVNLDSSAAMVGMNPY